MMYRLALLLAAVCMQLLLVSGQASYYCGPPRVNRTADECPRGWYKFNSRCYYFNQYPTRTRAEAYADCVRRDSLPLRIDNAQQFEFITNWLDSHAFDNSVPLYTSGRLDPANRFRFVWEWHNAEWRTEVSAYWIDEVPREGDGKPQEHWEGRYVAVLGNNGARWGWYLRNDTALLPYICEADFTSLSAALANQRDFEYGVLDIGDVQRSACIMQQPQDMYFFQPSRDSGSAPQKTAEFECVAYGNPTPAYHWYKIDSSNVMRKLDPLTDTQFSITNGKLTIHSVSQQRDNGAYACEAVNNLGSSISRHAQLHFGTLPTFPKNPLETINVNNYQFANIECRLSDNAKPRDKFNFQFFFKKQLNSDIREVRPDFRNNLFISQATGTLYFSEVTTSDTGYYYCQVGVSIGVTSQEKGPDVRLQVSTGSADTTKIRITDKFPASVPKNPMRGEDVRLECIGYGPITRYNQPLIYSWRRSGKQIPSKARYADLFKRVLIIPNVQIEDGGRYECQIQDGGRENTGWNPLDLTVLSGPYLITYPFDQFVDENTASVRFNCKSAGTPPLSYEWFRGNALGTKKLADITDLDKTRFNWSATASLPFLEIKNVQAGDAATYGCRVSNTQDSIYGFAQLKVMSFAPSFRKNPRSHEAGLVGKIVYLPCDAEGAPEPQRQWLKDSASLAVVKAADQPDRKCPDSADKCEMLSGRLRIRNLNKNDAGLYHCIATNIYGSANGTIDLAVADPLSFDFVPENRHVLINSTVDLPCQITLSAPNLDINYAWRFENTDIGFGRFDFDARRYEKTQFSRPYKKDFGTLRISNIQYDFEGNYTCIVQTPLGVEERAAYLRVAGPPGPCAGVQVPSTLNTTSFTVTWRRGAEHLSEVTEYQIELEMRIEGVWQVHTRIPEGPGAIIQENGEDLGKRQGQISDLPFYHQYRLRVAAVNSYGIGEPSSPTDYFVTASGAPSRVPQNVTGGGGKVKTLVVRWRQIDRSYQGAANFSYEIQYKLASDADSAFLTRANVAGERLRSPSNHLQYAIMLTGENTAYQKYVVRVRGVSQWNETISGVETLRRAPGNWSSTVEIYSAETVPQNAPKQIGAFAFNATAVNVTWEPPSDYDGVMGNILGYRIVYWPKLSGCSVENNADKVKYALRLTIFGKVSAGQVIGLEPDTFYCFSVQMFNSAGDTPESPWRDVTTNKRAPSDFPTNIVVHSTGEFSTIRVTWNGIRQRPGEESVDGYMVRYWITGAPATNFSEVDAGMDNEAIVRRLSTDVRYDLRVYGYSAGGIGTFSSPMIQFMIIPKERCVPGASWEAPDIKYVFVCSACGVVPQFVLPVAAALLGYFVKLCFV